jgi:hypothetical protein
MGLRLFATDVTKNVRISCGAFFISTSAKVEPIRQGLSQLAKS